MRHLLLVVLLVACGPVAYSRRHLSSGPCADETTYACLGAVRVRRYIIEGFPAPPPHRSDAGSFERAVELDVREAIGAMRIILGNDPDVRRRLRAARALAAMNDAGSAPLIAALARNAEDIGSGAWDAAVEALDQLGPAAALPYARDWMSRHRELVDLADTHRARWCIRAVMRANDVSALPELQAWVPQVEQAPLAQFDRVVLHSTLYGARMQLGEQPFRRDMQRHLGTPDAIVPTQPETTLEGLGYDLGDADALARFASSLSPEADVAYDGIDRLAPVIAAAEASGGRAARDAAQARARLIARLEGFTAVREDPDHPNFSEVLRARHYASLARLGAPGAAERLLAIARDPESREGALVAARHALELGVPGAADVAFELLRWGIGAAGTPHDLLPWQAARDLLDAAARTGDGRWSIALLDAREALRDRALFHMARRRPREACAVVTEHAAYAQPSAARPALTALTTLGPACTTELGALARQGEPRVRAFAIEVLAMLGDPSVPALLERGGPELDRARNIASLPP